ncbi:MAG: hypothetical protein SF123_02810 [Chloroflexota bacterium]|nr:hypothetical protein [Chloroflexota bacterium]
MNIQQTRRYILDILRERGEATVDEIVSELQTRRGKDITPVTVRHHISLLQQDALITSPELRRRSSPGRPQHVYALTEKARDFFPNNYERLAASVLAQLQRNLPPDTINVIIEGVADDMARDAQINDAPLHERMAMAVKYLNDHGYNADYEICADGYLLHTHNCPYHHISQDTPALCSMDMRLVASLVGVVPRLIGRMSEGQLACSYLIPVER